jgi:hypothetical protein
VVKLHFETTEEFEQLFKSKTLSVTNAIYIGIEEAVIKNRKSANLFQITFEQADMMYDISLPSSQWVSALEKCLEHYHKEELADEAIDCWKLLEAVKTL